MGDPPPMPEEAFEGGRAEAWLPPISRDASTSLMFGILGFASCGLLSPLAIYYGRRAIKEVEASGADDGGLGNARVGQLLGLIGLTLLVLGIVLSVVFGLRAWDWLSDRRAA